MIFFLAFFSAISFSVFSNACNNYEVSMKNSNVLSPNYIGIGVYKIDYNKICNKRPTFRHVTSKNYIFAGRDKWLIGNLQRDNTCDFIPYVFHSETPVPRSPMKYGWKYWVNQSDVGDTQIRVNCICDIIQVSSERGSERDSTHLKQSAILGTYKVNDKYNCNNRTAYKHVRNDYYIYIDNDEKWTISKGDTIIDKESSNMCLHYGVAINPTKRTSHIQSKSGWRSLKSSSNRWRIDASLNVICTCTAFRIDTDVSTAIAGKNNLKGIYKFNEMKQCNRRATYKHVEEDYYLYVDGDDTWMIGGPLELLTCSNNGYAYSIIVPSPDNPSQTSWLYYNYIRRSWCTDPRMTVTCE